MPAEPDHLVIAVDRADGRQGTDLRWTLLVDELTPPPAPLGHLRKRFNQLINANLRYTFGQ